VHVEQGAELGVGGLLGRDDVTASRVVDQYIDPAMAVCDVADRGWRRPPPR
jgi:hypothetical protein